MTSIFSDFHLWNVPKKVLMPARFKTRFSELLTAQRLRGCALDSYGLSDQWSYFRLLEQFTSDSASKSNGTEIELFGRAKKSSRACSITSANGACRMVIWLGLKLFGAAPPEEMIRNESKMLKLPGHKIGERAFVYRYFISDKYPNLSVWRFNFYG